ncbi:MAG: glycosyltransferase [Planctomycetota bacterium]
MKIRVLHVIDHLGYGGAQVLVKNISEKIAGERIETSVCALRPNRCPIPLEKAEVIDFTYTKYSPYTVLAIARLCREHKIDIIHAHLQKSIISSLLATMFCTSKVIIHEHGAIFRGGTGFMYRFLLKVLGSRAAVAIANSQAAARALVKIGAFGKETVRVVGNFVEFDRFNPKLYDRNSIRSTLKVEENTTVVGFVGRLDYCKGPDLLLDAAARLLTASDQYHFVIVGDGQQKQSLARQCRQLGLEEKVTFTGICENPAQLMRAFDIGLIPSRREAFGISAVEFMRMGVPVVASAVGGLVELIRDGETGILLDDLDPACIAEAVERLRDDAQLRNTLIENARTFSHKFDGKEQLQQLEDIYMKLVQETG